MNLTLRFYSMVRLSTKMPSLNQIHSNSSSLRVLCSVNMIKILRAVKYLLTYVFFSFIVKTLQHVTFLRASQKKEQLMQFQKIIQILFGKLTCLGCTTKKELQLKSEKKAQTSKQLFISNSNHLIKDRRFRIKQNNSHITQPDTVSMGSFSGIKTLSHNSVCAL